MKLIFLFIPVVLFTTSASGQPDWTIIQAPHEPLIQSRTHVFFANPSEGWIVGEVRENVILHTEDAGGTWEVQSYMAPGADTSWSDVFFINSNTGWVVGSHGVIWKTTDGGEHWADQTPPVASQKLNTIFAVDSDTLYAAGDGTTIFKTTNGGGTWKLQVDSDFTGSDLGAIYAFDSQRVFTISEDNNEVFYTLDGGNDWHITYAPFIPGPPFKRLRACTGFPGGTAYTVGHQGSVFKSTDFGQHWSLLTTFWPGQPRYLYSIRGSDADHLWTGGYNGALFYSSNGGASWDTLHFPTGEELAHISVFDNTHLYAFGRWGQFFQTSDGGQSFLPLLNWPNISLVSLAVSTPQRILAVSNKGADLTITENGGVNWSYPMHTTGASSNIQDMTFINPDTGFWCGDQGAISKTSDGGYSWFPVSNPFSGSTKQFYFIYFKDSQIGFTGGSQGKLLRTTNGGENWLEVNSSLSSRLQNCAFADANIGIIVADNEQIARTTDGGNTWTEVTATPGIQKRLYSLSFISANTGFATAASGYILKTVDAGNSWTLHTRLTNIHNPSNPYPNLYSIRFKDTGTGYISGDDGALYESTDDGATWTQIQLPADVQNIRLRDIAFTTQGAGFIVGDNGYILGKGLSGITPLPLTITDFRLQQNYPNPFNPFTTITFNIPRANPVSLRIYNTLGQVVKKLYQGKLSAGSYTFKWDGKNSAGLPSPGGIYFYKLDAGNNSRVKKMHLVR